MLKCTKMLKIFSYFAQKLLTVAGVCANYTNFGIFVDKSLCKMSIDKMTEMWYNGIFGAPSFDFAPTICTKIFNIFVYFTQMQIVENFCVKYTKTPHP